MKQTFREEIEKEIYQQMIAAIEQAANEGQPVREIYEAIQAGADIQVTLEPDVMGKVRLILSV